MFDNGRAEMVGAAGGDTLANDVEFGCPVCGLGLSQGGSCPNLMCRRGDRHFSVVFTIGRHDAQLRHTIAHYKYRRHEWLSAVFARMVADHLARHATWFEEFDLITGMPAYTGTGAARTWDPIGRVLSDLAALVEPGWQVTPGLVRKSAETPRMQGRSWSERQQIATGPLRRALRPAQPGLVAGARILVLDDVFTEGSTLREVARVLRAAGAEEVAGLVLARLPWAGDPPGHRSRADSPGPSGHPPMV